MLTHLICGNMIALSRGEPGIKIRSARWFSWIVGGTMIKRDVEAAT